MEEPPSDGAAPMVAAATTQTNYQCHCALRGDTPLAAMHCARCCQRRFFYTEELFVDGRELSSTKRRRERGAISTNREAVEEQQRRAKSGAAAVLDGKATLDAVFGAVGTAPSVVYQELLRLAAIGRQQVGDPDAYVF